MAKRDDMYENLSERAEKSARRGARRYAKGIHPLTWLIWLLSLVLGVVMGWGLCFLFTASDGFELEGREVYTAYVGQDVHYNEKGVRAVSFGRDISGKVTVKTELKEVADGVYLIDCSKVGEYTIEYTVDDGRYKDITLVRTFKVAEPAESETAE